MSVMNSVTVDLRLRSIDDFFRQPDLDAFSAWYEAYSDRPAIEYVTACVSDDPRTEHVDIVVGLPREAVHEDTERRLREAIDRYCNARLIANRRQSARNNSRGWLMLAFSIVVVALFVWTAQRFSESSHESLSIAAEGLSIAAWVLLWHPLEALVFNRWDFRLDRRVLRTIRDKAHVTIEPLDIPAEV
jgi:hypothetical protein